MDTINFQDGKELFLALKDKTELIKYLNIDGISKLLDFNEYYIQAIEEDYLNSKYFKGSAEGSSYIEGLDYIPTIDENHPVYKTLINIKDRLDETTGNKKLKARNNHLIKIVPKKTEEGIKKDALKAFYKGEVIKRGEKVTALYKWYTYWKKDHNRLYPVPTLKNNTAVSRTKTMNNFKIFDAVIKELTGTERRRAEIDCKILEERFVRIYNNYREGI